MMSISVFISPRTFSRSMMIWAKTNGISSHQGIGSIKMELDQTEQLATVTGRLRTQTGASNIWAKLLDYEGKSPKGEKTNWIVQKYRINDAPADHDSRQKECK